MNAENRDLGPGAPARDPWRPPFSGSVGMLVHCRLETREEIYATADANQWGVGETIEHLLEAFHGRRS